MNARLVLVLAVFAVLSGCIVVPDHGYSNGYGGKCPPGHAKKGEC